MAETTVVHLLRHGEVHNPGGVLYGRLPGYHLSETGSLMAETVAKAVAGRDIVALYSSPLERAQETAAPVAATLGLDVSDRRAADRGGQPASRAAMVGQRLTAPAHPRNYRYFWNPLRPSWGEPYTDDRRADEAVDRRRAGGGARPRGGARQPPAADLGRSGWRPRAARLWHDPRRRQCALASLTTFTFDGDRLISVGYSEPAGSLAERAPAVPGA